MSHRPRSIHPRLESDPAHGRAKKKKMRPFETRECIAMLTIDDCIAMCGLTEQEVDAIAQHEHLPEIVAVELGNYLSRTAEGERQIQHMIEDDIADCLQAGHREQAALLKVVLCQYLKLHSKACGTESEAA